MTTQVTQVISRKRQISVEDNGNFLLLSDTGQNWAGMWVFEFVPDDNDPFVGALAVMGRIQGQQAFDDAVPFASVGYRAAVLNGVASDYSFKADLITGHSVLMVPATGLALAVLVACESGKGTLYSYPRQGDAGLGGATALVAGNAVVGKTGADSFSTSVTFTRPANTTAYTAGDVMADTTATGSCTALTIPVAAYAGQRIRIDKMYITTSQATCVAQVRTQWYNRTRATLPVPTPVDNAAMTTILANDPYFKGFIDLLPLAAEAGSNTAARSPIVLPWVELQCAETDTNLYCTLTTNTAFTPDSAQSFRLNVSGVRF
jgi:hypothetical protein